MGRTLRRNIKKHQAAPFLTYILRKWKKEVDDIKLEREFVLSPQSQPQSLPPPPPPPAIVVPITATRWADWDEDDDGDLPELPSWFSESTPSTPKTPLNPWNNTPLSRVSNQSTPTSNSPIRYVNEYFYKNN